MLRPFGFNPDTFASLRLQASLQVAGRTARKHHLLPYEARGGLALLPEPDRRRRLFRHGGRSVLTRPTRGLEYLFGVVPSARGSLRSVLGRIAAREKRGDDAILSISSSSGVRAIPNLHVYHYANYEKAALGRLTMRYAARRGRTRQVAARRRLRRLSTPSCGRACAFRRRATRSRSSSRSTDSSARRTSSAATIRSSLFEQWLDNGDESILADIRAIQRRRLPLDVLSASLAASNAAPTSRRASGTAIPWYAPRPPPNRHRSCATDGERWSSVRDAISRRHGSAVRCAAAASALGDAERLRWFLANTVDYHWSEVEAGVVAFPLSQRKRRRADRVRPRIAWAACACATISHRAKTKRETSSTRSRFRRNSTSSARRVRSRSRYRKGRRRRSSASTTKQRRIELKARGKRTAIGRCAR